MKFKTTQREIKSSYDNTIAIGYCRLQHLLNCETPAAYTARREGWAADVYPVDYNTAIITGYSPFGNIRPGYEICEKYDRKAAELLATVRDYDKIRAELQRLISEFVSEVLWNQFGKFDENGKQLYYYYDSKSLKNKKE